MKKILLLVTGIFLLGMPSLLKAQCYGVVTLDVAANAGATGFPLFGNTTFNITTANANELIMISYNGWNGPGSGPVKVDGNNATFIKSATNGNSGTADVYAYSATTAGLHTIVCATTGYNGGYYCNFAAAFYCAGGSTPLTVASLTNSTINTIPCTTGGSITGSITTTIPGSAIYCSSEINEGTTTTYPISWTGATFLGSTHTEDGIDAGHAYEPAPCPATYSIKATNSSPSNNGCGGLTIVLVAIPATTAVGPCGGGLTVTPTIFQPTCGNCNGGISLAVLGGSAPYTYTWSPNISSSASASGLCAGTYSITIKDASCPVNDTTIVVNLSGNSITITPTITANEPCNGQCIGSVSTLVTGGSAPYTYTWTPSGGSNSSATGLCAGNYTVTVKDASGCTGTASVTITQPPLLISNPIVTNIPCAGGVGSINANASGGTSPYTYSWSTAPVQTNATATGLTVGTYTVTVEDKNGCTTTASASISQPTPLTAAITAITYPACGGGTGTATVTGTGGTLNYTYNWTPIGGTNATGTGLTVGTYTATVTDANGCTATASVTITQPTPVVASIGGITYPACGGGTGSAIATGGGGTSPYVYSWSTAPVQTNAMATGLTAGSYTVTVKDVNGCSGSAAVTITQPVPIVIATSFTQASCNLSNGSATANAVGGTSPYTYAWNPSAQTNQTATGLSIGTYTVTVTDVNHCSSTAAVTVTQPSAVVASITSWTGVRCNGGSTGTATASGAGGTGPYNYLWAPSGNTNATGTGLSAGTYTMTIKDANGCQSTASVTITQPLEMTVVASGPATLCAGATGTFTATVTGGATPYGYSWSSGQTTSIASITPVGGQTCFTVVVTDANGCSASSQTCITYGPPLLVSITGKASACAGSSVHLCANTSGGTGGNTYSWQPGGAAVPCITVSPSATTTYTLSVADNCGVTTTASVVVNINPYPTVGMFADVYQGCTPLCIQFRSTTTNAGNTAQYIWSLGNNDTLQAQSPIYCYKQSGNYDITLTVTSDSGCSATLKKVDLITVFASPKTAFTLSPQPADILNPTIQFTDKTADQYGVSEWFWNFGDGSDSNSTATNPSHTYKDTGSYCVTLIDVDSHGCTDTATNCLVIDPVYDFYIPSAFSPNGDGKNETFQPKGQYIQSFEMYIFDRWGMKIYHTTDITQGWNGTVGSGSTIAQEDTYVYKITLIDSRGKQHSYVGNVSLLK